MKIVFNEAFDQKAYDEFNDLISCNSALNSVSNSIDKFLIQWEHFPYMDDILIDDMKAIKKDIKYFVSHSLSDFKERRLR